MVKFDVLHVINSQQYISAESSTEEWSPTSSQISSSNHVNHGVFYHLPVDDLINCSY